MDQSNVELTPENAPLFAARIVDIVEKMEGVRLDYSVSSLTKVDRIIEAFRDEGTRMMDLEGTLVLFGCYVGEVFVHQAGARWRLDTRPEVEACFGIALILELESGCLVNPIGKVAKRLENGATDFIPDFYERCTQMSRAPLSLS